MKYSKRKYKKRQYNRKRKLYKRKSKRSTAFTDMVKVKGIPDRLFVPLVYEEWNTLDTTTQATSESYRLNSPRDPFKPTGGKSAMYFSKWAQLYNSYKVHSVKIFLNATTTNALLGGAQWRFVMCPIIGDLLIANSSDLDNLSVRKYAKSTIIGPYRGPSGLSAYYNLSKVAGVSKQRYNDDPLWGAPVNSDPVNLLNLVVGGGPVDRATDSTIVVYSKIVYYTEFLAPRSDVVPDSTPYGGDGDTGSYITLQSEAGFTGTVFNV